MEWHLSFSRRIACAERGAGYSVARVWARTARRASFPNERDALWARFRRGGTQAQGAANARSAHTRGAAGVGHVNRHIVRNRRTIRSIERRGHGTGNDSVAGFGRSRRLDLLCRTRLAASAADAGAV